MLLITTQAKDRTYHLRYENGTNRFQNDLLRVQKLSNCEVSKRFTRPKSVTYPYFQQLQTFSPIIDLKLHQQINRKRLHLQRASIYSMGISVKGLASRMKCSISIYHQQLLSLKIIIVIYSNSKIKQSKITKHTEQFASHQLARFGIRLIFSNISKVS